MPNSKRKKILVVEDQEDQRDLLKVALERAGYNVLLVQGGQDALLHAEIYAPDLILLDLMLASHMDGFAVLTQLKANEATASIPVIICSAWCGDNQTQRAKGLGAVECLLKPYAMNELHLYIERALAGAAPAGAEPANEEATEEK